MISLDDDKLDISLETMRKIGKDREVGNFNIIRS